ncbi:MAG TPA: GntR family transcriptional regulator [Actinopolymorphaceae bacterium]|jgi:DNA-binding GntR family transcriptional regulator
MSEVHLDASAISRGVALADQAYVALRDAILTHRLRPGTRLSVPEVARQLQISRSPAREAIARITHEGLATFVPNKGAVVAKIDAAELVEIYDLREVLEGLACRLATQHLTADVVEELERIIAEHEEAVSANDVERHMDLDAMFHQRIRQISKNRRLIEALDRLQGQIRVAMYTTRHSPGGMKQALAEHRAIAAALRSGDPDVAENTARAHIRRLRAHIRESVDREEVR